MTQTEKKSLAEKAVRLNELKGVVDCANGITPRKKNQHYLRGYGQQYETEQVLTSRAVFL